ncbi:MAG: hypothetical protein C3F11_08400 [Methylocystaceae bacterium]|nr:MAG: hypothetical protein C3F11_08400 [Methylocystaceae bacterium]
MSDGEFSATSCRPAVAHQNAAETSYSIGAAQLLADRARELMAERAAVGLSLSIADAMALVQATDRAGNVSGASTLAAAGADDDRAAADFAQVLASKATRMVAEAKSADLSLSIADAMDRVQARERTSSASTLSALHASSSGLSTMGATMQEASQLAAKAAELVAKSKAVGMTLSFADAMSQVTRS